MAGLNGAVSRTSIQLRHGSSNTQFPNDACDLPFHGTQFREQKQIGKRQSHQRQINDEINSAANPDRVGDG